MSLLKRLSTLEPVLVRAVIVAVVMLAAIWGANFTALGDQIGRSVDIIYAAAVLVSAWWARSAVTPTATVVETVTPDGTRIAGPASPLPTGSVIPTL